MIRRRTALAGLALPFLPGLARAEAFPDQPVRLIVPFAAGGPADIIARIVGRSLGDKLGKPVVVEARAGIDIVHVPYRGAAPALTDLMAGRIEILCADVPALIGQVRTNGVKPLAITASERLPLLPSLPTAEEAGVPGVVSETWYGLLAPAGVPAERVAILTRAARASLEEAETQRLLAEQGGRVVNSSPAEFGDFIRANHTQWGEVVRATGVRLE